MKPITDFVGKIIQGDCLEVMREMPDNSIDLVVTSPPYDNLRDYDGYVFDFENIAKQLFRIIKQGGVVVWVVGDATINGSETGTSFKQALYFKEIGFNIHDTMIYEKNSSTYPASNKSVRYSQIFEYMFILCKGKIKTHNLICDKKNKWYGYRDFSRKLKNPVPEFSARNNIWKYTTSFNLKTGHPAVFPEQLAADNIISWSNQGDVVLDIFNGSGTTCAMAKKLNRNFIGIEISEKYCEIAQRRIDAERAQLKLF